MFENAKWIAKNVWINWNFPGIDDMPPSPYLAKTFELKEKPQKAILNVCALGQGAYYFNGERIPDSYIPTHPSNYYKTVVYTSYDITDMTLVGKNRLGIMIGNNKYADQRAGFLLSYPKNKKVNNDIPTQYNNVTIVKLISILKTLNKVTKAIYKNIYITCKTDTFNKPFSILSLLNVLKINI